MDAYYLFLRALVNPSSTFELNGYHLPNPQRLDPGIKATLIETRKAVPRYLFRGWRNTAGDYSGGFKDLNTPSAITPLAYVRYSDNARNDFFSTNDRVLALMAMAHLMTDPDSATEFSSWGPSLQTALVFASKPNAYFSVIDTCNLEDGNFIVHVPKLGILIPNICIGFDCEYLVHGIVRGAGYSAVPARVLLQAVQRVGIPRCILRYDRRPARITRDEILRARDVGIAYGGDFVVPVTIAVLCQTLRHRNCWRNARSIENLDLIVKELKEYTIPEDWCQDESIMTDIVDVEAFGDVEQMINLMRRLAVHARVERAVNRPVARQLGPTVRRGRAARTTS